jgi:hypothetical protein
MTYAGFSNLDRRLPMFLSLVCGASISPRCRGKICAMNGHIPEKVAQKLDTLPTAPGCYQMLDGEGRVLYVGKAIVLRNRVRSYFHVSANHTPRTQALVAEIADITWWVTKTELEALVLENELIKRYQPHYNVRLKDDKTFPYIKVNWQEDFPKIQVVRRMRKDGARYFGPYTSSRACYETLDALRRVFPYLDCDREITGKDRRPCLYYHIKLCGGPCIGAQTRDEYRQTIQQLMHFLEGDSDKVLRQLQEQMGRAADNLQFELAALYRDRLQSAQRIAEQQKIVLASLEDLDYVAVAQDARTGDTAVQVFMVRHGRMVGRDSFMLEGAEVFQLQEQNGASNASELEPTESGATAPDATETDPAGISHLTAVIGAFIQQFYDNATFVPPLILLQALPPDHAVLAEWLADHRGSKVELRVPRRGDKVKVLERWRRRTPPSSCACSRPRAPPTPTARPRRSPSCNRCCTWRPRRRVSSATTSARCRAPTRSARWWSLSKGRRPKARTSASRFTAKAGRARRTTLPVCARCCAAASAAWSSRKRTPTPASARAKRVKAGALRPIWSLSMAARASLASSSRSCRSLACWSGFL